VGMQFGEVYSALQTRVVDGEENPLSLVLAGKFQEVQKFVSITNHVWDGYWLCCNGRVWKGLPAPVQDVIARNLDAGAVKVRADVAQADAEAQTQLATMGLAVNTTTPDSFRQQLKTAGFYKEWRGKVGEDAWKLLEQHSGELG
jgi:TRAP-type C4-dicarboxylate transport system substrate-binding protein